MKIRDEGLWLQVRMDLATDGEAGKAMEDFVTDWLTRADYALEENREFQQDDDSWTGMDAASALRAALPAAEARCGQLSFSSLIQALIIVLGVWEHGPEAQGYLTVFETRALMEMAAIKTQEMSAAAES